MELKDNARGGEGGQNGQKQLPRALNRACHTAGGGIELKARYAWAKMFRNVAKKTAKNTLQ